MQDKEEPELNKEFGDAGDDADIVDEKMWRDESDDAASDGESDGPNKDAGYNDKGTQEAGDESTRKMVAGGRDGDDDDNEDGREREAQVWRSRALL